jgi:hypothetical protein
MVRSELERMRRRPPRLDLDGNPSVEKITQFLCAPKSGRLEATRIARLYREPVAKFAAAMKVTEANLRHEPDRLRHQIFLRPFAQTARILPFLKKGAFAAWVRTPNSELKGRTPLELLWAGRGNEVIEVVEEVLVGQPD